MADAGSGSTEGAAAGSADASDGEFLRAGLEADLHPGLGLPLPDLEDLSDSSEDLSSPSAPLRPATKRVLTVLERARSVAALAARVTDLEERLGEVAAERDAALASLPPGAPQVRPGRWLHFRGRQHLVLGLASDADGGEDRVVYVPLYPAPGLQLVTRRVSDFLDLVEVEGTLAPRFVFLGDGSPDASPAL